MEFYESINDGNGSNFDKYGISKFQLVSIDTEVLNVNIMSQLAWVFLFFVFLIADIGLLNSPVSAQSADVKDLSVTSPKEVGLSSDRLEHLTQEIDRNIEEGHLAGSVVLIARNGKIAYLNAAGMQDIEEDIPMKENTIFRIASMTKPITTAAVMMLYEEGRFLLSDPISEYIPAFEDARVLADSENSSNQDPATVPAENPVTIRDLLTHTSGLVYHWNNRLGPIYNENGITHGLISDRDSLAEDIPKLAKLPLLHEPGEQWTYGLSIDVLGYLIEVVSGMPLDEFFNTRIFEPLGMDNTQFHVSPEQESQLATAYTVGDDDKLKRIGTDPLTGNGANRYAAYYPLNKNHRFLSGGGGLTSTVPDYYKFCQMILNGGELNGKRLLSPKTVELMTTDHVGDLLPNMGFGYGFEITRDLAEEGELDSPGSFGWGSFWYGTFFIDPAENMIGISIAQKHPAGGATLNNKFGILARQAIVK
jgi:CubicO group peptidase (beta-lactamase class C family)